MGVDKKDLTYLIQTDWSIKPKGSILKILRIVLVKWHQKENPEEDWEYVVWTEVKDEDDSTYFTHGDYNPQKVLEWSLSAFLNKMKLFRTEFAKDFKVHGVYEYLEKMFTLGG